MQHIIQKLQTRTYNFLRWSEKYTKTDMVYLTKGGFWLTTGQIISSASVFVFAVIVANFLPKETYGTYKYILSIASILSITSLSGMNASITQAVARGYDGSFMQALKAKIRWGILGGLASIATSTYYYLNNNTTLALSFLMISIFIPFINSFTIYQSYLSGKKVFNKLTAYVGLSQIISTLISITVVCLTNNIFAILLAYFMSWTILRGLFLKQTLKKHELNTAKDPQTMSYGKHLSLIGVIGTIASHIDKILIFHYLGAI